MITEQNIKEYFANSPQITFEVTERCNLKCKYCGYGELYGNKSHSHNRDLHVNNAISVLEYIKDLWLRGYDSNGKSNIYISFYGGEPLLNMDVVKDIISFIEREMNMFEKKFIYTMTTNALLLKKHISYLIEKDFQLLISLDGNRDATSYRIYPNSKPAFDNIINNVDYVKFLYPDYFEKKVSFNAVLNDKSTVNEINKYIYTKYHKVPTISEINNVGIKEDMIGLFNKMYRPKLSYMQEDSWLPSKKLPFLDSPQFERIARYFQMYSPYFFFDYNELLFLSNEKRKKHPTGTCMPFSKKIFITVDGKLMPCERIGYQYVLGEVKDGNLLIDFKTIADKYNLYYAKVMKSCSKCKDFNGCLNCFFNTGQLDSSNSSCNYFVSQRDYNSMLQEVYDFIRIYPEAYEYIMSKYEII